MRLRRAAIGLSPHLGWAAAATIVVAKDGPRVLRSERLVLTDSADREASEPYHVAGGFDGLSRVPQPPDPQAALAAGLRKQRRATARTIGALAKSLAEDGHRIAFAGLLVGRGRPAPSFEKAIGSHTQIHVEEGLAVRESLRRALEGEGARIEAVDQKAIASAALQRIGRAASELLAELAQHLPENDGPWRKEERTAALAAWIAWARHA